MLVNNEVLYRQAVTRLEDATSWIIDVETNGLDPYGCNQICGVGVGINATETYYFPFRHQQGTNLTEELCTDLITLMGLRESLIGYNIKFDIAFLQKEGLCIENQSSFFVGLPIIPLVDDVCQGIFPPNLLNIFTSFGKFYV